MVRLTRIKFKDPFGVSEIEITPDESTRRAAWGLYVELVTRISVQRLGIDQGLVREALTSLHSLLASTRQILRDAGPRIARGKDSVGGLAIKVLNHEDGLRSFLSKWHPMLQDWEEQKPDDKSSVAHEKDWQHEAVLRGEMDALRQRLADYAEALAKIAGVKE